MTKSYHLSTLTKGKKKAILRTKNLKPYNLLIKLFQQSTKLCKIPSINQIKLKLHKRGKNKLNK